jgi:hypothetical protein
MPVPYSKQLVPCFSNWGTALVCPQCTRMHSQLADFLCTCQPAMLRLMSQLFSAQSQHILMQSKQRMAEINQA